MHLHCTGVRVRLRRRHRGEGRCLRICAAKLGSKGGVMFRRCRKALPRQAAEFLKNMYRVLLTRGLKGCYVFFEDKEIENYVKARME